MIETKTKLIDLINEAKARDFAENKANCDALVPKLTEQFIEFFGIKPDTHYYSAEFDRSVFTSGGLEVVFTGSLREGYGFRKSNEWGMIWTCPVCGRKFRQDYGYSDLKYLDPEMPHYVHNHDDPQADLIEYLRKALGIGQDE